jgi:hypothetical protein
MKRSSARGGMFLVVLALGSLGACRRGEQRAPKADAVAAPAVSCEAAGRMNLTALAGLPELGRLTTTWLRTGAPELSAALRAGAVDPLDGMERAQICQTSRRSPTTGGREVAVTMSGPGAPALFGRLAGVPVSGRPARRQQIAGADVLVSDRTWVALQGPKLVMATTEEILRRVLTPPPGDALTTAATSGDDPLLSLTFSGGLLQDILAGGRAFRIAALNAIKELRVDFAADGTGLTARLATADSASAEQLRTALEKFLSALRETAKHDGTTSPPDLAARVEGREVVVTAGFGRQALGRFAQAFAMRSGGGSRTIH